MINDLKNTNYVLALLCFTFGAITGLLQEWAWCAFFMVLFCVQLWFLVLLQSQPSQAQNKRKADSGGYNYAGASPLVKNTGVVSRCPFSGFGEGQVFCDCKNVCLETGKRKNRADRATGVIVKTAL